MKDGDAGAFVSWRLLKGDGADIGFHVWRLGSDGKETKITEDPLVKATSLRDSVAGVGYRVVSTHGGEWRAKTWQKPYLEIPLDPIEGYRPGDCSVGDLDGDGEWELIVHQVGRARDNGSAGLTDPPILDAYKLDGTRLWRIDLGKNIREGEHYTQFMVYDLDGDGCAEVACKTADGSRDGRGKAIGDASKDWRCLDEGTQKFGRILEGPEYLTVFDGKTGGQLDTVEYVPGRGRIDGWGGVGGNGGNDNYGNRCDRFLACVAYLDGEKPSLVMTRGVYGRIVAAAWDFRDGKLKSRWVFDSGSGLGREPSKYAGMGGHSLTVADVDADGRDEILYQAMAIDDDGKGLFTTGRRHGDAMHVADFDPSRPGMELYLVTENEGDTVRWRTPGAGMHCAKTGELLWSNSPGVDISHGVVADIDPRHPGAEVWGGPGGLRNVKGETIGPAPRNSDWVIWWDGDLLREIYGASSIFKWEWKEGKERRIFQADQPFGGQGRRYGFGFRPNLAADLLGDWREELLLVGPRAESLRLHVSTESTPHRLPWLMQDRQYRLSIVWQNVVYNKPPHVGGFFMGER
jgi:rhamnogalacturonan endolyase